MKLKQLLAAALVALLGVFNASAADIDQSLQGRVTGAPMYMMQVGASQQDPFTKLEPWFDYILLDPVTDEIATNGVKLTGGKACAAGTVLSLTAKAPKAVKARGDEWVFAGWYSEKAYDSALNNGSQDWRLASGYKFTSLAEDVTLFARFVPKSVEAQYLKVECFTLTDEYETGKEISPSIPVEATAYTLPKVKVSGLPSGLKFAANKGNSGKGWISGKPKKSGVYTALVTMTTAGKATATTSVKFVVRKEDELKVDVDYDATKGKVTGAGIYAAGKKVTLKATANKGYVFTGWWEGDERKSQAASYVIDEMPTNDVKMAAKFITKAVYDKETDTWTGDDVVTDVAFQGWAGEDLKPGETNTWYQGVKVPASKVGVANFNSQTPCSISASGLPSGVKFDKDNLCFTGVPTKAGLFKVTFSFKNASGAQKFVQMVEVEELPVWTIGNFDGSFIGVDVEVAEGVTNRYTGMTTFTVGKTGKISGTAKTDLGKIKFSAASFDRVDLDGVTPVAYWVDLEGSLSYNKKTVTVSFAANVKISGTTGLGVIGYNGDRDCAVQNPWNSRKELGYPSFPTSKDTLTLTDGELVLKFGKNGAVKVSGRVLGDSDAVSVSGSSQVQPAVWNGNVLTAYVEVFVAPKKGLTNGFFKEYEIQLTSDEAKTKFEDVNEVKPTFSTYLMEGSDRRYELADFAAEGQALAGRIALRKPAYPIVMSSPYYLQPVVVVFIVIIFVDEYGMPQQLTAPVAADGTFNATLAEGSTLVGLKVVQEAVAQ